MDKYSKIIVDVVTNNNISKIDLLNVDFEKLLVKASHNRVLHVFCKRLLVNAKSNISNSQRKILEKISQISERYLLLQSSPYCGKKEGSGGIYHEDYL